ncbi:MAG: nucleotide sugar dehydrogenase [Erysipelotrichaceae bacterium]|jgi:UDPglucose 6-dehydrogenase|nr:nucleotide sugar dehydrogenase [Erysipelotrichaceae bacterium]
MKITVVGIGYVGLSLAVLLSIKNEVVAIDISKEKVDLINRNISPIEDKEISEYLSSKKLNLSASINGKKEYKNSDFVIVATPTNYDDETNMFDTSSVESVVKDIIETNPNATIIIKSTVGVGFTNFIHEEYPNSVILFSPEFLREGKALYDNLHPSRIIVGVPSKEAKYLKEANEFANMLKSESLKENVEVFIMCSTEAEAVKLFSNTYLALRVSYFNELDTFATLKGLNAKDIVDGVSADPRIGDFYNNPSFGYGGYCLPKDTKELKSNFKNIPENLITAVVQSNMTRKKFIYEDVVNKLPKDVKKEDIVIGIYKLAMKFGSDNFRYSSILDIIDLFNKNGYKVTVYEPSLKNKKCPFALVEDVEEFKKISSVILANRFDPVLSDVVDKVYTKDLFRRD